MIRLTLNVNSLCLRKWGRLRECGNAASTLTLQPMGNEVKWVKVPVVAIVHVTVDPVNTMNGLKGLGECACKTQRCAHTWTSHQ